MIKPMFKKFRVTDDEFTTLCNHFRDLCRFQSWQLLRKNAHNNHTDEQEDIEQDLLIAVLKAGVYYKRQVYIEECLRLARRYAKDPFVKNLVRELISLWKQRTKHGANRQRFGEQQELILDNIVIQVVSPNKRPDPNRPLVIDKKFATYCKQITWNQQKSLGKAISRSRSIRNGMVSLSQFECLY